MGRDLALRLTTDQPGELSRVAQTLSSSGVNIEGIAEIGGVVHVLARDPSAARAALRAGGFSLENEIGGVGLPLTHPPGRATPVYPGRGGAPRDPPVPC